MSPNYKYRDLVTLTLLLILHTTGLFNIKIPFCLLCKEENIIMLEPGIKITKNHCKVLQLKYIFKIRLTSGHSNWENYITNS